MKLLDLFRKTSDRVPQLSRSFFRFDSAEVVHSGDISENIKTKKKYYYKVFIDHCFWDRGNYPENLALYIAVSYTGTKPNSLKTIVEDKQADFNNGRYPIFFFDHDYFAIYLEDIRKTCVDIHIENDCKEGKNSAKYIFHCADNENDFDIYLVLYDTDICSELREYLLGTEWNK